VSDVVQAWDGLWESHFGALAEEDTLAALYLMAQSVAAFASSDATEGAECLGGAAALVRRAGLYRSEAQAFGELRTGSVLGRWADDGGACV
jgi:hypothetical protein